MSFLDKNKEVLQQQYTGLWEELVSGDEDELPSEHIKIETAPAGNPTLSIKGMHIHSPRDPAREAKRLIETINTPQLKAPVVILGFGLGYAAEAAASLGLPVIIVEKHKNLLLKAFELRDFSGFLSNNRLLFIAGGSGDGITSALGIANELTANDDEEKKKPYVIRNKALIDLDEHWYKSIEDKIRTWSMRDDVNTATHKKFGKRWIRNLKKNMIAIRDLPGVSHLAGLAEKSNTKFFTANRTNQREQGDGEKEFLPVFLAAAGPSLDRILPLLRDIYERCIIVAVDTSLRFFVRNGIQPDFVLVVDPQFWNSRHLDRCIDGQTLSKTALIGESAVYPPVLNLPFKNKLLCGSLFPLGTFIEKQVDSKGRLGAGGSVATTAWDFARTLGANEIWIAGLDLSFPGLKTHFNGARFEEKANSESCRFYPVEKWTVNALRGGFPFKAPSADGGQVLTDRRLSLYAAWFENQFKQYPQIQNYCFFQDGLKIAGLTFKETKEFLSLPKRRGEIDSRVKAIFEKIENEFNNPQEKAGREKRYANAVSLLERGIKNIRSAAEEGAEISQLALRYPLNPQQQNKVIKELDEITRRVKESDVKEIASFLLPLTEGNDTQVKDEKDQFKAYLNSSLKLFSAMAESMRLYKI